MIFYVALDENGNKQLRGTQADARAVNRNFEQIDIPTDKAGLMAFVQDLYTKLDNLHVQIEAVDDRPITTTDVVDHEPAQPEPAPPERASEPAPKPRTTDDVEELWPNLPLPFRFHLCAMTMEDARNVDWNGTTPAKAPQRYAKAG